jgi:hypothetical protein
VAGATGASSFPEDRVLRPLIDRIDARKAREVEQISSNLVAHSSGIGLSCAGIRCVHEFFMHVWTLHAERRLRRDERPPQSDIPAFYPANRRHISSMSLFLM